MFFVVLALIILAFVLGWKFGDKIAQAILKGLKFIWKKLKELFNSIFKKKEQ